jgi:hypothetical protein
MKVIGFAMAVAGAILLGSAAQAKQVGAGNTGSVNVSGKVHINQNGNGCRNRCYGDQTYNAGFNNGNTAVIGRGAPGHSHGKGNAWGHDDKMR